MFISMQMYTVLVLCTRAAVEVHGHRDTPTQRLRILCTVLDVYTIKYYYTSV